MSEPTRWPGGARDADPRRASNGSSKEDPKHGEAIAAAFEPFGGRRRNRSWEVLCVADLPPDWRRVSLPVSFARLQREIPELVAARPRALLLLGEAPCAGVRVEQIALNVGDTDLADNAGQRLQNQPLVADGPLALGASWNARELARALQQEAISAAASFHAGTYACNAALYLALHAAAGSVPVGFLHVPRRAWPRGQRTGQLRRAVELAAALLAGEEQALV